MLHQRPLQLQHSFIHTILQSNEAFLNFEQDLFNMNKISCLVQEQIYHLELIQQFMAVVFKTVFQQNPIVAILKALNSLNYLIVCFETSINERLVSLFMQDDIMELQSSLNRMCSGSLNKWQDMAAAHKELSSLLAEIYELFNNFETHLSEMLADLEQFICSPSNANENGIKDLMVKLLFFNFYASF